MGGSRIARRGQDCSAAMRGGMAILGARWDGDNGSSAGAAYVFRGVSTGLAKTPARSTLSYANNHRPWELFEDVFHSLLGQARAIAERHKRKCCFKNPLRNIDSSTIHLCREVFDWTRYGRTKGAIKLHLMLDHQGCLPGWACITEGKVHDATPIKALRFAIGTIVAMDRGYNNYGLFGRWCEAGVYFVTRLKSDAIYRVVEWLAVPACGNVLSDELIELDSIKGRKKCPHTLQWRCLS